MQGEEKTIGGRWNVQPRMSESGQVQPPGLKSEDNVEVF